MRVLLPSFCVLASLAGPGLAQTPPSLALVIGNSAYAAMPALPACELSANLAAASLSRAGFRVTKALNPSNAQMGSALATLGDAVDAAPGARAVVYFCGYATAYGDRSFILPIDARLDRESDVLTQGIVARLLVASALSPKSAAGLAMLDWAPTPNGPGAINLASMLRPADEAHGGVAAAPLRVTGNPVTGPLAAALSDMVLAPPLEIQAALATLAARPNNGTPITVRAPSLPSMLLDAPAAPTAAPPIAPAITPPAMSAAPPPPPAEPEMNTADRRRVQLSLKQLGLFRGQVTGRFGPDTLAAIRHFQADSDEEQTGRLTARQAERLVR